MSAGIMVPVPGLRAWGALASAAQVDWIVKHLIEAHTLNLLYGQSGSGKSFLAFDMLAAVARGIGWFGHRTTAGTVLYVAAEGAPGCQRRELAYVRHHGLVQPIPFWHSSAAPDLLNCQEIDRFIDSALSVRPRLIALDTLSRMLRGAQENDSSDMGKAIEAADRIRTETGASVILVHHSGKDANHGPRGHSSLFAACDTVIEVARRKDGNIARLTKARDSDVGIRHCFRLQQIQIGFDEDGEAVTSCVVTNSGADGRPEALLSSSLTIALSAIRQACDEAPAQWLGKEGLEQVEATTLNAAKARCEALGLWRSEVSGVAKRKAWQRAKDKLEELSLIEIQNDLIRLCSEEA
jgi:hypothetical protein